MGYVSAQISTVLVNDAIILTNVGIQDLLLTTGKTRTYPVFEIFFRGVNILPHIPITDDEIIFCKFEIADIFHHIVNPQLILYFIKLQSSLGLVSFLSNNIPIMKNYIFFPGLRKAHTFRKNITSQFIF